MNDAKEENQQQCAAEVLELGESLFEAAFEAGNHRPAKGEEVVAYPLEEMRSAADSFFSALRILLRIEE